MPPSSLTILIVNEHAEEVKLITISVRGFFPDVRIDSAYSVDEAVVMASATHGDWVGILIDDGCLSNASPTFIEDLKRRAPYASIIFQSTRTDSAAALQALQIGADFFLYKQSPAFLTELLFCLKEAIDKRDWQLSSERADTRQQLLINSFGDVFYELDAESRFLTISPNVSALVGYQPQDLIGRSYQIVVADAHQQVARFRFNERRASPRAVTGFEVVLQSKQVADLKTPVIATEISARGLYDSSRRFLGTVGIIRNVSERRKQEATIQALQQQLQRSRALRASAQEMTSISKELQQPLSTLLREAKQLAEAIKHVGITDRLDALADHATASARAAERLHLFLEAAGSGVRHTINDLIAEVLNIYYRQQQEAGMITTDFASLLPDYHGDHERTIRLFQQVFAYARAYLSVAGRSHPLLITTRGVSVTSSAESLSLSPLTPSNDVDVTITESGREAPTTAALASPSGTVDVVELYRLTRDLGATLNVSSPVDGPFQMTVRLPTEAQPSITSGQPMVADVSSRREAAEAAPIGIRGQPPQPTTNRRIHSRATTTLPAVVTIGSAKWSGTVIDLSQGGASIRLPTDFPAIALQEAYITVRTAVATLELSGMVYQRTSLPPSQPPTTPYSHMVVSFHPIRQAEAAVLSSLIEAAQDHSLTFTLEILLTARPSGGQDAGSPLLNFLEQDRRETVRVSLSVPARLETTRRREPGDRLAAQLMNLSRGGACLVVKEQPEQLQRSVTIHFAPAQAGGPLGSHEAAGPDTALRAEIVWSVSDSTAPSMFHIPGFTYGSRVGLRFHQLSPYGERELNRVIKQHILAQQTSDALANSTLIVSVSRECRSARGQTIAITDDHLSQLTDPTLATIILAPGYGQMALDYAAFSYYLAEHHFRVLRYDATNHIGNSEGELQHTTLRSMQHDLGKVIEFVRHTWPQAPVIVIASDLGARAALKTAAQARPLDLLILVNPSIDVGSLLMAVHGHDLIADYQFGLRRGVCNLLGLNVNVDQFVGDLIAGHFTDLESTLEDIRLLRSPLCIATSPTTPASLPPADLSHPFMTALGAQSKLVNLSTPLIGQNLLVQGSPPVAFKQLLKQIASVLAVPTIEPQQEVAAQPYLARQCRIEQEFTVLRHDVSQISREALCAAHLSQLPQVGNLQEYRKLLDDLYGLMSPIDPGALLIDAGIGQSDLTRAALVNHTYRAGQFSWVGRPVPLMVGVGRDAEAIDHARHAVRVVQRELATGFVGRLSAMPPLTIGWVQADWTEALPFKTGSLHRLVSNLSLPYVLSPLRTLQEWFRVMHPDGCLIITAFHAETDLSPLYRRHLRQANQDEFSVQAQPLLHYFARLREAIRHGVLHTFDELKLDTLLRQSGMVSFRILPIFDSQALVVIVGKRNSSSSI